MEDHPYTHTNPHTDPRVMAAAALIGHLGMVQQRMKDAIEQKAITLQFLKGLEAGLKKDQEFLKNLNPAWEEMFGVPFPKSLPKEGEDVLAWLEGMLPDRTPEKAPRKADGQPRRIRRPRTDEKPATGQADASLTVQVLKVGAEGDCEHQWETDTMVCLACGYQYCEVYGHSGIPQNRKGRVDCHICQERIMTPHTCTVKYGPHPYSDYGWCPRCNDREPDWSLLRRANKWEKQKASAFDV